MAFLHPLHHLEVGRFELVEADAAQNRVADAGGAMHGEAEGHQPVDHFLDLGLGGPFLH